MSKLKGKLTRRIMAIVLSGAMVMSNMSAYAAELVPETEVVSEVEETAAAETTAETAREETVSDADENAETESSAAKSSESKAEEATETKTEDATEAKTEDTAETETDTEAVESTVAETETESVENKETEADTEKTTTKEETTEEKDNKETDENITCNQGSWAANSRTTSWDFITKYPTSSITFAIGDTLKGIKVIAKQVQQKNNSTGKTVGQGLSLTAKDDSKGTIAIPLDSATTSVAVTLALPSVNDKRYIVIGNTAEGKSSKKVYQKSDSASEGDDSFDDKKNYTGTFGTEYMTIDADGNKWLYIAYGDEGETKINTISITETKPGDGNDDADAPIVYEMKASELTTGVPTTKTGKEDFFTVTAKKGGNISVGTDLDKGVGADKFAFKDKENDETLYDSNVTEGNAGGIKFGGSPSTDNTESNPTFDKDGNVYASVGFTVPSGYMAEIKVAAAAKADAAVGLYGVSDGTLGLVGNNTSAYKKGVPEVATFSYIGEGTYCVANTKKDASGATIGSGNSVIYYVRVTLTKVQPVAWENVPNPKIDSASQEKDKDGKDTDKISVNLSDAVINADTGSEKVKVTMYSGAECTEEQALKTVDAVGGAFNATDGKATATFAPDASGTYYFKAVGNRSKVENKEDVRTSNVSAPVGFVLPLTVPVMVSSENIGDGKIEVTWGAVKEATNYDLKIYSDSTLETEATGYTATRKASEDETSVTYTVDGLAIGGLYYFTAAAIREGSDGAEPEKTAYSAALRVWVTQNKAAAKYHIQDILEGKKLEVGKIYGGGSDGESIMTLEIMPNAEGSTNEDGMPSSPASGGVSIGGVTYHYSIQGKDNPAPNKGEIPKTGAAFKINPIEDSVITFVMGAAAGKPYHFIQVGTSEETGEQEVLGEITDTTTPEGSLKFKMSKGYTYYFYLDGSKAKVYDISYSLYVDNGRLDWDKVEKPVIKNVAVPKPEDKDPNIVVTVDAFVGDDGGDSLTVEMYDAKGEVSKTGISTTEADSHKITFTPPSSGKYTFKAILERGTTTDEEGIETEYDPKETDESDPYAFILPLSAPAMSSITNKGGGTLEIEWVDADEANGYIVKIYSDAECKTEVKDKTKTLTAEFEEDGYTVKKASATSVNIEGLTVGETYYIRVASTRTRLDEATNKVVTDTSAECTAEKKEITADEQTKWSFAAYGSSTSITDTTTNKEGKSVPKNGYSATGSIEANAVPDQNGTVNVWSMGGAGKVVPATVDGLAFYYTAINPKTTNFTLSATAYVNEWVLSNGQDGFGLMAADQVGKNGNGDYLWTNSYQAVVSKIEYNWDGEKVTTDTTKPKISMKIGVGATEKIGATKKDVDSITAGDLSQPENWSATQTPLDTTFAKYATAGVTQTCNIVGNSGAWNSGSKKWVESTVPSAGTKDDLQVEFKLTLQKNNTGYFLSYVMPNGETMTKKYYDTEALNHIIEDKVYIGFFAARNANVTFKDITFTTIKPEDDAAPEPQEPTYITLTKSVVSSSTTNTSDYDLIFTSNWSGNLVIKNSDNKVVGSTPVTGTLDTTMAPLKEFDNNRDAKVHVALSGLEVGSNAFTLTFTPSKNMKNPPAFTELESYDPVTIVHTVDYRTYGTKNSIIYVAPNGKTTGTGTEDDPLDVFTAVKYAQPGQVIYLAGGRYSLYKKLKIDMGINGTPENMITMMADPKAKERPVFDFNGIDGMTIAGSYWYFKGFDVTHSKDAMDGIQVSGSHNTLDQINAYKNGNTGIQVSGSGNDTYKYWPSYNTILNCTSYLNSDHGYEDADGFAAKLTTGSGNVFDGCIAAYNADDGWDLFAKIQTGQIGYVTIKNCVAYKNGYVLKNDNGELDLAGKQIDAGNGNGFKMGGDGLPGGSEYEKESYTYTDEKGEEVTIDLYPGHKLINSVSFANKAKGIDSNSCSNNEVINSISINNGSSNVGLYTYSNVKNTWYRTKDVISYRTKNKGVADEISVKGQQATVTDTEKLLNKSNYDNETTYLWNTKTKAPTNHLTTGDKWGGSISGSVLNYNYSQDVVFSGSETPYDDPNCRLMDRKEDGTINIGKYLTVTGSDAGLGGTPSAEGLDTGKKPTDGTVSAGNSAITDDTASSELGDELEEVKKDGVYGLYVKYLEKVSYTGLAVQPEIRVYLNGTLFTDYKVSYRNNVNAYVAGNSRYSAIDDTKRPTMILTLKGSYEGTYEYYFDINPVDITDKSLVSIAGLSGTSIPANFAPALIYNGKKLAANKDYSAKIEGSVYTIDATTAPSGNFTGVATGTYRTSDSATDISKAAFKLAATNFNYTGEEVKPGFAALPDGVTENDLEIYYSNNIEVGKATVTITGKDEDNAKVVGSKTLSFTIKKTALKAGDTVKVDGIADTEYTGAALSPGKITVEVADANGNPVKVAGVKKGSKDVNVKENGLYKYGYTYQYKSNTEVGSATLTITGIHNYTGSASYKFKISPASVTSAEKVPLKDGRYDFKNTGLEVGYAETAEYTPNGTTTDIIIKYNGNTVSKKNYSVSYKNNKNANDPGTTATIKWKGGLKNVGATELSYTITPCDFTSGNVTAKSVSDVFTNGKDSFKLSDLDKSRVVLVNAKKPLARNREYTLTYEYTVESKDGEVKGTYDPVADKAMGKTEITFEGTRGVDVKVYAKPVGANFKELPKDSDGKDSKGLEVAEFRVAYYNIAQAKFQLVDKAAYDSEDKKLVNTKIYFVDDTETQKANLGALNRLNNETKKANSAAPYYLVVSHSKMKERTLEFSNYANKNTPTAWADYTYDYENTSETTAGKKSVVMYGTGMFGGTKVFKYTLNKKAYNISKATVVIPENIDILVVDSAFKADTANITPKAKRQIEEGLAKGFEGKITNVNGLTAVLSSDYYECVYDKDFSNWESGKAITVIIKGKNSYSGSKKVKVKVSITAVSDDFTKAAIALPSEVTETKANIDNGYKFDFKEEFKDSVVIDGYTLIYGTDFIVNDADYIIYAKDENGNYIEDAKGATMKDENGNIIKNDKNEPIKFKTVRNYKGYCNNNKVSAEDSPAYVCLKGIGEFSGIVEIPFTIKEKAAETEETPAN